jgi:hypothetical protein
LVALSVCGLSLLALIFGQDAEQVLRRSHADRAASQAALWRTEEARQRAEAVEQEARALEAEERRYSGEEERRQADADKDQKLFTAAKEVQWIARGDLQAAEDEQSEAISEENRARRPGRMVDRAGVNEPSPRHRRATGAVAAAQQALDAASLRVYEAEAKSRNNGKVREAAKVDDLAKVRARGDKLRALSIGNVVLFAPTIMKVGDVRQVDANVGLGVPLEQLRKNVRSKDQQLEGSARISARMATTLLGAGFQIAPLSPEEQTIAEGFATMWSWRVEAMHPGEQTLLATLYALWPDGRQRVDSYTQSITIYVREQTWSEWIEAFGHGFDLAKSIVVALFGLATVVGGWFGISFAFRIKKSTGASALRTNSDTLGD